MLETGTAHAIIKTLFIAEEFYTGDDIESDMNSLISYFRKFEGKHPKEIPDFKLN